METKSAADIAETKQLREMLEKQGHIDPAPAATGAPAPEGAPSPAPEGAPAPAAEGAPAPAPAQIIPEADQNNVKDYFGDLYDNWDAAKAADIPSQLQKLKELTTEHDSLTTSFEALSNPFANNEIAELNGFVQATGINDLALFNKIKHIDLDTSQAIDVVVAGTILETPELKGQEAALRGRLLRTYNQTEESEAQAKEDGLMDLQVKATGYKKTIQEYKDKIKAPDFSQEVEKVTQQKTEARETLERNWTQVSAEVVKSVESISLASTGVEKGYVYEIPEESRGQFQEKVQAYLLDNNMPFNKDSVALAQDFMRTSYLLENLPAVLHAYGEDARSKTSEDWAKRVHNPSVVLPANGGAEATPDKATGLAATMKELQAAEMDYVNGK